MTQLQSLQIIENYSQNFLLGHYCLDITPGHFRHRRRWPRICWVKSQTCRVAQTTVSLYEESLLFHFRMTKALQPTPSQLSKYVGAVVTADGSLFTWGFGDMHQLGHGVARDEARPRPLQGLMGAAIQASVLE